MDCTENESKIIDYVDGVLTSEEVHSLEQHLESCATCQQILKETQVVLGNIANVPPAKPSANLRTSFLEQLAEEKRLQEPKVKSLHKGTSITWKTLFQIAASLLLLLGGYMWGGHTEKEEATQKISQLQNQTQVLKQDMALAMLDNRSASKRIQAVSYTEEITAPDTKILEALIDRMEVDANVNVRLAAAEALSKFSNNEMVKDAFIQALTTEKNPNIQISVIQFLVKVQDKRAKAPMQNLLEQTETPSYVKDQVNEGLVSLM